MRRTGIDALTCRICGVGLKRHPAGRHLIHRNDGVIAACDRDADHPPTPDWAAVMPMTCTTCGDALCADPHGLRHQDPDTDADHSPDPWPPSLGHTTTPR